jgi:hypothetical protein
MAEKHRKRQPEPTTTTDKNDAEDHPLEKDAAVEWGEGIHTGKIIARSGKPAGPVAGASESLPPSDR